MFVPVILFSIGDKGESLQSWQKNIVSTSGLAEIIPAELEQKLWASWENQEGLKGIEV